MTTADDDASKTKRRVTAYPGVGGDRRKPVILSTSRGDTRLSAAEARQLAADLCAAAGADGDGAGLVLRVVDRGAVRGVLALRDLYLSSEPGSGRETLLQMVAATAGQAERVARAFAALGVGAVEERVPVALAGGVA